jgi:hypothetical protein
MHFFGIGFAVVEFGAERAEELAVASDWVAMLCEVDLSAANL